MSTHHYILPGGGSHNNPLKLLGRAGLGRSIFGLAPFMGLRHAQPNGSCSTKCECKLKKYAHLCKLDEH